MVEPNHLWARVARIMILGLMSRYTDAQFVILGSMSRYRDAQIVIVVFMVVKNMILVLSLAKEKAKIMKLAHANSNCLHILCVSNWVVPVAPPHVVIETEGRIIVMHIMSATLIPEQVLEPMNLWAEVVVFLIWGSMTS